MGQVGTRRRRPKDVVARVETHPGLASVPARPGRTDGRAGGPQPGVPAPAAAAAGNTGNSRGIGNKCDGAPAGCCWIVQEDRLVVMTILPSHHLPPSPLELFKLSHCAAQHAKS